MVTNNDTLPDSGHRSTYPTGAQRDNADDKSRMELISPHFLIALGHHLRRGAKKYSDRNWEKGMPLSRYIAGIQRHTAALLLGDTAEDHAAAAAFNIMCYIHTLAEVEAGRLPADLDDMPRYLQRPLSWEGSRWLAPKPEPSPEQESIQANTETISDNRCPACDQATVSKFGTWRRRCYSCGHAWENEEIKSGCLAAAANPKCSICGGVSGHNPYCPRRLRENRGYME